MAKLNRAIVQAIAAAMLMVSAAALGNAMMPQTKLADQLGRIELERVIPQAFGDWRLVENQPAAVVNPQQLTLISKLYSETLSRAYVNSAGQHVMLSIAYGEDQRDQLQAHKPDVCYPAQGFTVQSNRTGSLDTGSARIPVRRLETSMGERRFEPLTYWITVGEHVVSGGIDKKLAEMRHGLNGVIPDGLLFRVSSIERDSAAAFDAQRAFVRDLLTAVPPDVRRRLAGY